MTRRKILEFGLMSPIWTMFQGSGQKGFDLQSLKNAPGRVVAAGDSTAGNIRLIRDWNGALCRSRIVNEGRRPARVKQVVLFDLNLALPSSTRLYGEGFQMLSQTGGTIAQPADLGNYTDARHYKMPMPENTRVFFGMMTLAPPEGNRSLLAFTSSRRFNGEFHLRDASLRVVIDTEALEIGAGQTWELEEFTFRSGPDRAQLLADLAQRMGQNHRAVRAAAPPTGWCSWYCFGPRVTAQQVLDNLDFIAKNVPSLKYIQIDDGYQPAMGDWLETGAAFGGNVQSVLKQIRDRGFEPAIWVAPFVAEENSNVFRQHPDWFVTDEAGRPLRSDLVTFGGWRRGPWYVLDGTHPEVHKHFETVFGTMRRDWGCTYFKLDANFWGAIHGGRFRDPAATRIVAYRRGMQAILRGAGDSFILGCNHPIWPSLGLIHGSRSSNDIRRDWNRFKTTAQQNLNRNWQNGRLWWNDPDAVVLTGDLSEQEFQFHATVIYASGGMVLSGDDLTKISSARLAMLRKLLPPAGIAADFDDDSLRAGWIKKGNTQIACVFNWNEKPQTQSIRLLQPCRISDYWTGEDLGRHEREFTIGDMAPHSAKLLVCSH
jgi:alpha-galactosidase